MQQQIEFQDLGLKRYQEVWDYQESLLKDNATIKAKSRQSAETIAPQLVPTLHHLLFLEHNPVYTLGKSGKYEHLLINEKDCAARGIEYFHINRGGDITFHGPGQLVGYPILE